MGNNVFANGREISCKAADGKAVCAFPDVCFTPPQTPATPPGVPIPYPNTAFAKDTAKGSKNVKISAKEVMLRDKSHFKTSTGDEAGSTPKKGILTGKIKGKAYFNSWSMNVKIEGQNVVRHLDLTTHNHGSYPGNSPVWPYLDSVAFTDKDHPCHTMATEVFKNCDKHVKNNTTKTGRINRKSTITAMCNDSDCKQAKECVMSPQSPSNCCVGKTPHHPIPTAEFSKPRKKGQQRGTPTVGNYKASKAPCICVEGENHDSREGIPPFRLMEHGRLGAEFTRQRNKLLGDKTEYKYSKASELGANAVKKVTGCDEKCAKAQIDSGHHKMDVKNSDDLRKSKQKADVPENLPDSDVDEI